jgi:hypothetical protein
MQWNAEYMKDAFDRPLKVMTVKFFKIWEPLFMFLAYLYSLIFNLNS